MLSVDLIMQTRRFSGLCYVTEAGAFLKGKWGEALGDDVTPLLSLALNILFCFYMIVFCFLALYHAFCTCLSVPSPFLTVFLVIYHKLLSFFLILTRTSLCKGYKLNIYVYDVEKAKSTIRFTMLTCIYANMSPFWIMLTEAGDFKG